MTIGAVFTVLSNCGWTEWSWKNHSEFRVPAQACRERGLGAAGQEDCKRVIRLEHSIARRLPAPAK